MSAAPATAASRDPVADGDALGRARMLVLGVALLVTAVKLVVATGTAGTLDMRHWVEFAAGVGRLGPIGVYTGHYGAVFNHPPLIGWWLELVNAADAHGFSLRLMIRLPAILADIASALLVLELVRTRRGLGEGKLAGVLVALSPILIVVSGYHGNTDPVFVMLTVLAAYLLVDRRAPFWAGVAIGLAVSVKLVPVVALPALVVIAWRRRNLSRLALGGAGVFVFVWLPAVLGQWSALKANVLDYAGSNQGESQWGLGQLFRWLPGRCTPWTCWTAPGGLSSWRLRAAAGVARLPAARRLGWRRWPWRCARSCC